MDSWQLLWEMIQAFGLILGWMWPVTLFIIASIVIRVGMYLYRRHRWARAGLPEIDKLSGTDFERYLEQFFRRRGYQVKRTPAQGDYGADLILRQGGDETAVQVKRYDRNVGVKAVQEAVASKQYYGCSRAMVVTNSHFTQQARALAKANGVELWDRNDLASQLVKPNPAATVEYAADVRRPFVEAAALSPAASTLATVPSTVCATCGKPVSPKVQDYCLSHADRFGGAVYCYEHQKEVRGLARAR